MSNISENQFQKLREHNIEILGKTIVFQLIPKVYHNQSRPVVIYSAKKRNSTTQIS